LPDLVLLAQARAPFLLHGSSQRVLLSLEGLESHAAHAAWALSTPCKRRRVEAELVPSSSIDLGFGLSAS